MPVEGHYVEIKRENVTLSAASLTPYAKNARTHSPEQVAQISASIKEFGFTNPIIVSRETSGELLLIAGHGRLMAAQSLGMAEIPAVVLTGLTEAQRWQEFTGKTAVHAITGETFNKGEKAHAA